MCLALAPMSARAEFTLAASVGKAFQLAPSVRGEPTTLMVSPGWGFADMLRVEVGLALAFPDLAGPLPSPFDIQIRPTVVVAPPLFPLYLRVFAVVDRLINGVRLLPGAALGVAFGVSKIHIFIEAGALPRFNGSSVDFLLEPRAGVLWNF
jgi:hypothetical protein